MPTANGPATSPGSSLGGCLLRLFWMILGNFVLILCAIAILDGIPGRFSHADAAFWGVVALLLIARYLDIRLFQGHTGFGQPATVRHWLRYAAVLIPIALAIWGLAHALNRL